MQCSWMKILSALTIRKKPCRKRVVQYFKDRTESFDDYYPCNSKMRDCNNNKNNVHVYNCIELFISMYNNIL